MTRPKVIVHRRRRFCACDGARVLVSTDDPKVWQLSAWHLPECPLAGAPKAREAV